MLDPKPAGRCFHLPQDCEIFNCVPFPIGISDYGREHPGILWANQDCVEVFGKKNLQELRAWDFTKVSEGVQRMHDEYFETVQVKKLRHGPTRRTMHPPSGAVRLDFVLVPIDVVVGDSEEPRPAALTLLIPAPDEAEIEAVCGHYMVDRVSSLAMLFVQDDGKLIQQNTLARSHHRKLNGRPNGEVNLREVLEHFVWDDHAELDTTATKIQELDVGQGAVMFDRVVKAPDNDNEADASASAMWLKMKFEATLDPTPGQKERVAILVSGQDISDQRNAQSDLLRMKHQQDQVFAEMAHELRTPLHAISSLSDAMLHNASCPRSLHKSLSIIHSQAMRLAAMVSDIVDSASTMRKTLLIKHEYISLHAIAQSACDTMATLVKRGVGINNNVPTDLPTVQADSSRLFQVLVNLMGNAIRFTSKGHITLSGRRVAEPELEPAAPTVELTVADSGIGIPADKLGNIFGAFEQVDADTTRKYGGSGLGLALVKTLVEAHHGTVSVRSKHGGPGAGTEFTIRLPVAQPSGTGKPSLSPEGPDAAEGTSVVAALNARRGSALAVPGGAEGAGGSGVIAAGYRGGGAQRWRRESGEEEEEKGRRRSDAGHGSWEGPGRGTAGVMTTLATPRAGHGRPLLSKSFLQDEERMARYEGGPSPPFLF